MKNPAKILSIVLAIAIAAVVMTACSVSGNTYTFDSIEVSGTSSATESADDYESRFKRDVAFSSDGSYTVGGIAAGYYKKVGNKIYVGIGGDIETSGEPQYRISGGKLVYTKTFNDGVTVKVVFKKSK